MFFAGRWKFSVADEVGWSSSVDISFTDNAFHNNQHNTLAFSVKIQNYATKDKHHDSGNETDSDNYARVAFQVHSFLVGCTRSLWSFLKKLYTMKQNISQRITVKL